jgi:hypothetical protein
MKQIGLVIWILFGIWLLCLLAWLEPTVRANALVESGAPVAMLVMSMLITFLRYQETDSVPPRDVSRVVMVISFVLSFRAGYWLLVLLALGAAVVVELLASRAKRPGSPALPGGRENGEGARLYDNK